MVKDYVPKQMDPSQMTKNINELKDKVFEIRAFKLKPKAQYLWAEVQTDVGLYGTFSKVLIDQLEKMRSDLEKEPVRVGLKKIGNYYTFAAP